MVNRRPQHPCEGKNRRVRLALFQLFPTSLCQFQQGVANGGEGVGVTGGWGIAGLLEVGAFLHDQPIVDVDGANKFNKTGLAVHGVVDQVEQALNGGVEMLVHVVPVEGNPIYQSCFHDVVAEVLIQEEEELTLGMFVLRKRAAACHEPATTRPQDGLLHRKLYTHSSLMLDEAFMVGFRIVCHTEKLISVRRHFKQTGSWFEISSIV